jgi:hypothetical protein
MYVGLCETCGIIWPKESSFCAVINRHSSVTSWAPLILGAMEAVFKMTEDWAPCLPWRSRNLQRLGSCAKAREWPRVVLDWVLRWADVEWATAAGLGDAEGKWPKTECIVYSWLTDFWSLSETGAFSVHKMLSLLCFLFVVWLNEIVPSMKWMNCRPSFMDWLGFVGRWLKLVKFSVGP